MRFIHNDGIAPRCNSGLPGSGLRLFFGAGFVLVFGTRRMQQAAQYKRKLLQRGNNDLGAINQRISQLLGVLVNGFHHTLRMLNLINGILQLLVQHLAVSNDDNAVEYLLILRIVQTGQAVRQPGNAVSLAAACRMLNQVMVTGILTTRRCHQCSHRI